MNKASVLSQLRGAILVVMFLLITVPLMPVQQVLLWTGCRWAAGLPVFYHRLILWLLDIRVIVEGDINRGATLLVANHVSWLDILVIGSLAPLSFVAKREVAVWPLFGSLARLQRTVFVDRERRTGTRNTIDDLEHRFAAGDRMVLFAEGTSSDGNRVLPFRSALLGAVGLGRNQRSPQAASPVAVQPLSVAYTHVHGLPMGRQFRPRYAWYGDMRLGPHLWGVFCSGSVDVRVRLHPAVSPGRFDSRKHLARHCEDQVRAGVLTDLLGRPISPPTDAAAPLV